MSSCTKICSVSTGLDINPAQPDLDGSKIWRDFVAEVRRTNGCRSMQYGYQLEEPDVLDWTIGRDVRSVREDWDNYEAAVDFNVNKSDNHVRIYEELKPWMRGRMTVLHVVFVPHAPVPVAAPEVTEKFCLSFDSSLSGQEHQEQTQQFQVFEKALGKHVPQIRDVIGGWALEEIDRAGRKLKVFVVIVTYESREARIVAVDRLEMEELLSEFSQLALDVERISYRSKLEGF